VILPDMAAAFERSYPNLGPFSGQMQIKPLNVEPFSGERLPKDHSSICSWAWGIGTAILPPLADSSDAGVAMLVQRQVGIIGIEMHCAFDREFVHVSKPLRY
jgi:hypothetical protein